MGPGDKPEEAGIRALPSEKADGPAGTSFSRFFRRAASVVGLSLAIVVVLLFFWSIAQVLLLVFAGLLLAVLLHGLASRLSAHTPLSYGWSLALVGVGLLALLSLAGWLLVPRIADQLDQLTETIPQSIDRLEQQVRQYGWGAFLLDHMPAAEEVMRGRQGLWQRLFGVVSTAVGILANLVIILVTGVYLAASPDLYKKGIVRLVPLRARARAHEVLGAVGQALWQWLIGQFISMTIIGVCAWIGLMLLGVELALILGLIAGLLEFVPLIGPWVGAAPAVLLAFAESPTQALYVGLLFLGIQQLESNVVTPLVMKEAVSLPPVLTLTATLVGGVLFGLAGILLATPLTVAIMVLVQKLYVEDVLGDTAETSDA